MAGPTFKLGLGLKDDVSEAEWLSSVITQTQRRWDGGDVGNSHFTLFSWTFQPESFFPSTQDLLVSSQLTYSPGLSPSAPPWLVASSLSVPQFPPLPRGLMPPSAHIIGAAVKS